MYLNSWATIYFGECAKAGRGVPTPEEGRCANHPCDNAVISSFIAMHDCNQGRPYGNAAEKVLRSINRINNPVPGIGCDRIWSSKFFTDNQIMVSFLSENLANLRFYRTICIGDRSQIGFGFNL
jgi:hypothetical protein